MKKIVVMLFFAISMLAIAQIVYITPTGKKYHPSKTCPGLRRAKKIIPIELQEAIARGYKPCKKGY